MVLVGKLENTYNKFVDVKLQVMSDKLDWLDWVTPETILSILRMGLTAIQSDGSKERNKIDVKFSLV